MALTTAYALMRGRGGNMAEPEPKTESDEQIARRLWEGGYILFAHYDVWRRAKHGETIYRMRKDYPKENGSGTFAAPTLYDWVRRVDRAIADARMIEQPTEKEPNPFGVSIAQSHDVRKASDGTPTGRVQTEESTWNYERLMIAGKLDRYSRKR